VANTLGRVRQVVGKTTRELPADDFAQLRRRYSRLVVDIGTGDGKHVLAQARRQPDALVVGLDANGDAMRAASARAAGKPARGGVPNALFVWAAVEQLPPEIFGVDEVHVLMPWGSLLRALVQPDLDVLHSVGRMCRPGAGFLVTLNLHAWRPPVPEVGSIPEPTPESARGELAPALAAAGWRLTIAEYLDEQEIAELATSWTKRLGASRQRLDVLSLRGAIDPMVNGEQCG
jgi:16S rRNA (adenine(1408)-N(1))-methyltransferase